MTLSGSNSPASETENLDAVSSKCTLSPVTKTSLSKLSIFMKFAVLATSQTLDSLPVQRILPGSRMSDIIRYSLPSSKLSFDFSFASRPSMRMLSRSPFSVSTVPIRYLPDASSLLPMMLNSKTGVRYCGPYCQFFVSILMYFVFSRSADSPKSNTTREPKPSSSESVVTIPTLFSPPGNSLAS